MPPGDTSIEVARRQREVYAAKSPSERVEMLVEMSAMVRELALEGVRRRSPELSPDEELVQLVERMHGPRLAQAAALHLRAQRGD